jgi:formylglycine-generating enzyme required for sulfatase activity
VQSAFAVGKHEVTRAQFVAFSRQARTAGQGHGCVAWVTASANFGRNETDRNVRAPGYPQGDDHPAVCVSWDEAQAYAEWLSRKTGKRYRLLSEAEWEYAARAGTTTSRPWGEDPSQSCREANLADEALVRDVTRATKWYPGWHACRDGHVYTAPAGRLAPNAFGLHDMIGNAWEWVEDCWNDSHAGAPGDSSPRLTGDCTRRVYRGGAWRSYPDLARSALRSHAEAGLRHALIGFRVARELDDDKASQMRRPK